MPTPFTPSCCPKCRKTHIVKNGKSYHGRQRFRCWDCGTTFGEKNLRVVPPEKKAAALAQYMEGVGQRSTERLVGVSHNSITNWVKKAVFGKVLKQTPAADVEWVEADEMWTYVSKKKRITGSGGLLIVLPNASLAGRWGIVQPARQKSWMRNFLTDLASPSPPTSGTPTASSSRGKTMSKAKPTPSRSKV